MLRRSRGAPVIFVTIGSMFPFDRMIRAMDAWAAAEGRGEEILAQIGAGDYEPRHMTWVRKLDRRTYAETIRRVAARRRPRRRRLDRHRGRALPADRGAAAARRISASIPPTTRSRPSAGCARKPWVHVADDEGALPACIAAAAAAAAAGERVARTADPAFIDRLRRFIEG